MPADRVPSRPCRLGWRERESMPSPFNHYSLLGTTEQLLHLPRLGRASAFPTLTSAFRL
jgi:hypothetical protein